MLKSEEFILLIIIVITHIALVMLVVFPPIFYQFAILLFGFKISIHPPLARDRLEIFDNLEVCDGPAVEYNSKYVAELLFGSLKQELGHHFCRVP